MLEIKGVSKIYTEGIVKKTTKKIIDNVSIDVNPGEIVGLVGRSGCGKTTLAKIASNLIDPSSGSIHLDGVKISGLSRRAMKPYRNQIQIVFQNPEATLNPKYSVLSSIAEGIDRANIPYEDRVDYFSHLMSIVNLSEDILVRRPYQISGGELQRAVFARVLAVKPRYLILDEPTSMLDVSVQANILNLIKDLKMKKGLGMLFISHDIDVIKAMCDRVFVMDNGVIVESGDAKTIFSNPQSDITKMILDEFY